MTDEMNYQVDQLEDKVKRLHEELITLNAQVIAVEKNLLVLRGEATLVEKEVTSMASKSGWLYKIITAGFVTSIIAWIVAGGLAE